MNKMKLQYTYVYFHLSSSWWCLYILDCKTVGFFSQNQ